jgi:hypothetical protein
MTRHDGMPDGVRGGLFEAEFREVELAFSNAMHRLDACKGSYRRLGFDPDAEIHMNLPHADLTTVEPAALPTRRPDHQRVGNWFSSTSAATPWRSPCRTIPLPN